MPDTRSVITFSKREGGMPMPHLLEIQTAAFKTLLVPDDVHGDRQDVSLERVFRDLFPITDVNEKYKLEFLGYSLGADHPLPGVVGRVHDRHPRCDLRPYRQEEEVPGHRAAPCLRPRH